MARNAVAKRKAHEKVSPDDLQPGIAKGLTQGASVKEAFEEHPVDSRPSGIEIARDFSAAVRRSEENPRAGGIHFIARLDTKTKISEPNTGRDMIDAEVVLPPEHRRQIIAGARCINCYEHFGGDTFPLLCPLCGFEVRERQILRAAHEFEGDTHVGPKKPIREYLDAQDERMEKRQFIRRVLDGGMGQIPSDWLRDATLLEGLTRDERLMIGARP